MNTQCPHCDCEDGYAIRHDHAINEEFLMVCDCVCHESKPAGEASLCSSPSRQDNLSLEQTESLCDWYDHRREGMPEDIAQWYKSLSFEDLWFLAQGDSGSTLALEELLNRQHEYNET